MASVNKVILIGNLGADPELRFTANQTPVCSFRIATTETWKDKSGEKQEKTEWHSLVAWGKTGEVIGEYFHKGDPIFVEGKLSTRKWQDKSGNDRYTTEVIVGEFQFLSKNKGGSETRTPKAEPKDRGQTGFDDMEDDIPF